MLEELEESDEQTINKEYYEACEEKITRALAKIAYYFPPGFGLGHIDTVKTMLDTKSEKAITKEELSSDIIAELDKLTDLDNQLRFKLLEVK